MSPKRKAVFPEDALGDRFSDSFWTSLKHFRSDLNETVRTIFTLETVSHNLRRVI